MWLHVPREYLVSAPEEEDSTSASALRLQLLAQSATWNTTSLKPESWARVLKRAPWTTRLSGLTCLPSTAERGAARWIASLEASPASRTLLPGNDSENSTLETSGLSLPDWYSMLRQQSVFSKTLQLSLITTGETSDPTYRPWVTRLRRASSQRRKSAHLTFGKGSSSWPTPTAAPEAPNLNSNTVNGPTSLGEAVSLWMTPAARDWKGKTNEGRNRPMLPDQVEKWQTPGVDSFRSRGGERKGEQGLSAADGPSLPAPVKMDGQNGSPSGRVLNPAFAEMLMGWPSGHTDYTSSETELCRWWQRMRGVLSRLGWE